MFIYRYTNAAFYVYLCLSLALTKYFGISIHLYYSVLYLVSLLLFLLSLFLHLVYRPQTTVTLFLQKQPYNEKDHLP